MSAVVPSAESETDQPNQRADESVSTAVGSELDNQLPSEEAWNT